MFKNFRAFSAFVGLVALFFMSVAFLATCSSGDDDERPPTPKSAGSSISINSAPDPAVDVEITRFEVYLNETQEFLSVEFVASVAIRDDAFDSRFDSVLIKMNYGSGVTLLNGDKKRPLESDGRGYSWYARGETRKDVSGDEYCGKTFNVCYEAFAKGNVVAVAASCYENYRPGNQSPVREEAICRPPSSPSAESSSSAVVSKQFTQVSDGVKINQSVGVTLSTGTTTGISGADIYYVPSSNMIMAQNNFKIMERFYSSDIDMCSEFTSIPGLNISTNVITPTNTSEFIPCRKADEEYPSIEYTRFRYYLVKASSEEWSSSWFLIRSDTRELDMGEGIEVKIWRVN
jgi:hypothetical protein